MHDSAKYLNNLLWVRIIKRGYTVFPAICTNILIHTHTYIRKVLSMTVDGKEKEEGLRKHGWTV